MRITCHMLCKTGLPEALREVGRKGSFKQLAPVAVREVCLIGEAMEQHTDNSIEKSPFFYRTLDSGLFSSSGGCVTAVMTLGVQLPANGTHLDHRQRDQEMSKYV